MFLRAVVAARQGQDHWIVPLDLAQRADGVGVVGERVVGEDAAWPDVGTHSLTASLAQTTSTHCLSVCCRLRRRSQFSAQIAPVSVPGLPGRLGEADQ